VGAGWRAGAGLVVATDAFGSASQLSARPLNRCELLVQPETINTANAEIPSRATFKRSGSRQQNSLRPDFPHWNTGSLWGTIHITQAVFSRLKNRTPNGWPL